MNIKLIGDPGSCHLGDLDRAKELIRVGAESGLDAVKFQLFPNERKYTEGGNVYLPAAWMPELIEYGNEYSAEVFASIFPNTSAEAIGLMDKLVEWNCKSIKAAYSQRVYGWVRVDALKKFERVYVSGDYLDMPVDWAINLYCIPQYPVPFEVSFDRIFDKFQGFSDHTLGIRQTIRAIQKGAKVIEKHFKLGDGKDEQCPDGRFAITPDEIAKLREAIGG
jgi:sialic acid synthase SpsE